MVVPSRGVTTRPWTKWQDWGGDVPCTVVVERVVFDKSDAWISRALMTQGSTNVMLAWSSIIAKPSIYMLVLGWLRITGQVRLNDFVRRIVAVWGKAALFYDFQSRLEDAEIFLRGRLCKVS